MKTSERGIVLTMVLYIIVVFVIIGLVLVTLMTVVSQSSHQLMYTTQAYYIAESGLEYGLYLSALDPVWKYDNGALSFNGSTESVTVKDSNSLKVTGSLSIEFWIKPTNIAAGRQNILDKAYGGEYAFTQETSGSISFFYGQAGAWGSPYQGFGSSAGAAVNNEWHHFTLVRNLSSMMLYWYKDGSLDLSTGANYASANASTCDVKFGLGYTGVYYSGLIDEVRIYNRALNSDEITYSYNYKVPMNRAGLVGWWKFTPGYDSIDSSGNNNRATKTATPTTGVYKSAQYSLATGVAFNPGSQSNCSFSVAFAPLNNDAVQNGTITSVGSVAATQVFSLNSAPAQRVVTVNVPRIY